jgi:squalene monooxygenase
MYKNRPYDICVVGAGVAGSAFAASMARKGYRVAVVEKDWSDPDEIIGELLQPGGAKMVEKLGLEGAFDGYDAQKVTGYALFLGGKHFSVEYPEDESGFEQNGYGFRYGKFVHSLRSFLQDQPNIDLFDGPVTQLIEDEEGAVIGIRYKDKTDDAFHDIEGRLTVVSEGASSPLRKSISKGEVDIKGYMLGLLLENCELPYPKHGHVFIADPAPVLAYPVSSKKTRVLIDFPKSMPPKKGPALVAHLKEKIAPQLPEEIREAFLIAVDEQEFKARATCLLPARPIQRKGVVLLGDSLNMRHPVTGGGMTVALTDAYRLGLKLDELGGFNSMESVQAVIDKFYKDRHKENATVNILAYALYSVFRHPLLKKACFDYLKKGGRFSAQPMSILGGVSRKQSLLIRHFFAVAWFGVKQNIKTYGLKGIRKGYQMLSDAVHIISPLIAEERPGWPTKMALKVSRWVFPS